MYICMYTFHSQVLNAVIISPCSHAQCGVEWLLCLTICQFMDQKTSTSHEKYLYRFRETYKEEKYTSWRTVKNKLFALWPHHYPLLNFNIIYGRPDDITQSTSSMPSYTLTAHGSKCSSGHFLLPSLSKHNLRFGFLPHAGFHNEHVSDVLHRGLPSSVFLPVAHTSTWLAGLSGDNIDFKNRPIYSWVNVEFTKVLVD